MQTLPNLKGARVLDVGCGEGADSVLLAALGAAKVTGIDLSPKAVDLAWERARIDGVADRVEFHCQAIEQADLPAASFDIVWCNAILHHLTHDLDRVLAKLASWARPGGVLSFAEPTNLNHTVRALRQMIPIKRGESTPDERPLEWRDLDVVRKYVPDLQIRHFCLLGRLDQFILTNYNYERSSLPRRLAVNVTGCVDWLLLSLPFVDRLGSCTVMWGTPNEGAHLRGD